MLLKMFKAGTSPSLIGKSLWKEVQLQQGKDFVSSPTWKRILVLMEKSYLKSYSKSYLESKRYIFVHIEAQVMQSPILARLLSQFPCKY